MNIAKTVPILSQIQKERFWGKVFKSDGCWDWKGAIGKNGYGVLKIQNQFYRAHRISYFLKHEKIDKNLHIDHLCHNRCCVNPDHLEEVTLRENVIRGIRRYLSVSSTPIFRLRQKPKAREKKTHCSKGHPYDKINSQGRQICSICHRERSKIGMRKYRSKCF